MEVLATDGRYTVVADWNYDAEIVAKILAALGMPLSKQAEQHWPEQRARHWLDFRCVVVRNGGPEQQTPLPLARRPTQQQIDDYTKLFAAKSPNGGCQRGDSYLWFSVLDCCEVSPLLFTRTDHDILPLTIHSATAPVNSYVLLSDKPAEVLLSGPKWPRPWHLKQVLATRDAHSHPALELAFDEPVAAGMARLSQAHPGRALVILFDNQIMQIRLMDVPLHDKLLISGSAFDENLVAQIAKSLRECMIAQDVPAPPVSRSDGPQ